MKVLVIGGVFREGIESTGFRTPETLLVAGLRDAGIEVDVAHHHDIPWESDHDIIHIHHRSKRSLHKVYARKIKVPIVFTGHSFLAWPVPTELASRDTSVQRRVLFAHFRAASAIVALSESEATAIRAAGVRRPISIIPNGTQPDFGLPVLGEEPKRSGLLFVGQLTRLKGIEVLLRSMTEIDSNVRLRLVYHRADSEAAIRRLVIDLGIEHRVEFVGKRFGADLVDEYVAAQVLVLPSFGECLPSAITEAMVCGATPVASSVGGIVDQIGPFGATVTPGDSKALAAALNTILGAPQTQQQRTAMSAFALEKSDRAHMLKRHLQLYEALLTR